MADDTVYLRILLNVEKNGYSTMNKAEIGLVPTRGRRWVIVSFWIVAVATFLLLSIAAGCRCPLRGKEPRKTWLPGVQLSEKSAPQGPKTELILTVENSVENITLSPNRKRMLLETRVDSALHNDVASNETPLIVELWNVEFIDARPEAFTNERPFLVGAVPGLASFDEKGERIFWIDQEFNGQLVHATPLLSQNTVIRGAAVEDEAPLTSDNVVPTGSSLRPLPLYLPWGDAESDVETNEAPADASTNFIVEEPLLLDKIATQPEFDEQTPGIISDTINEDAQVDDIIFSDEAQEDEEKTVVHELNDVVFVDKPLEMQIAEPEIQELPFVNVVLTKPLESDSFLMISPDAQTNSDETKHMRTAIETKTADSVWISTGSKWLACHTLFDLNFQRDFEFKASAVENSETTEAETSEPEEAVKLTKKKELPPCSFEWALVPVRDRSRVVRFPKKVKMTFDSSTSDEEFFGCVVDVLAISDAQDLVATLVEEISPTLPQTPRYKIVIWDLNVALTVNLEKAFKPLRAVEVSQIAVPCPVEKKYCRFSPSGNLFAARIDPRYISIWQSTNGRSVVELGEHPGVVEDFEFSPGTARIVVGVGSNDPQVLVWEIRKGIQCHVLDNLPPEVSAVNAVAFSNDERYIYFANDINEVRRWDIRPRVAPDN